MLVSLVVVRMLIGIVVIMLVSAVVVTLIGMVVVVIMLVSVVVIITLIGMVVVIVFIRVHARAEGTDFYAGGSVDQIAAFAGALYRIQQRFFVTGAIDDDQVGLGDGSQVARRRIEGVRIGANRNQRTDLGLIASHVARDIRQNAVRGHDMKLAAVGKRRAAGQQQSKGKH